MIHRTLSAAFIIGGLIFASTSAAATLKISNETDEYVTVNVDGVYCVNTAGHTIATCQVSEGHHTLVAQAASGATTSTDADIGPDGATWHITH